MKKILSSFIIIFLLFYCFVPFLIVAEEFETKMTETETTGTTTDETKGTVETDKTLGQEVLSAPVVKALWTMNGLANELLGTDDGEEIGTQFLPSGQYQVSKPISVCAVIFDEDGIENIDSSFSEIYYPMASFGQDAEETRIGCGEKKGEKNQMITLTKSDGIELFCNNIQNNNATLPTFYDVYDFSGICGEAGDLETDKAVVYCSDTELLYDDIAGEYKVLVFGQDKEGVSSNILSGTFNYLALTAFEADFTALDYGEVMLNARKTIEGDLIWNEPKGENQLTIRNVGNTRAQIKIEQDDMCLGKTDGVWNVRYGTKIGQDSSWQNYWPEEAILLDKALELSGMDGIDFAIEVLHFPEDDIQSYSGNMDINAQIIPYLSCASVQ